MTWIADHYSSILAGLTVLLAAGSLWVALRKDARDDEGSRIAVRKNKLELATMIEAAAEKMVARVQTQNEDLTEQVAVLHEKVETLTAWHMERDAREAFLIEYVRDIHEWIERGYPPPPPTLPDPIRPFLVTHADKQVV